MRVGRVNLCKDARRSGLAANAGCDLAVSRVEGIGREGRIRTPRTCRSRDGSGGRHALDGWRSLHRRGRWRWREQALGDEDGRCAQPYPKGSPCNPDQAVHVRALNATGARGLRSVRSSLWSRSAMRGPCHALPARKPRQIEGSIGANDVMVSASWKGDHAARVRMSTLPAAGSKRSARLPTPDGARTVRRRSTHQPTAR